MEVALVCLYLVSLHYRKDGCCGKKRSFPVGHKPRCLSCCGDGAPQPVPLSPAAKSRFEDLLAVSSRAQFPESYFDVVLFPLRELRHLSLRLKNVLNAEQHPKGF